MSRGRKGAKDKDKIMKNKEEEKRSEDKSRKEENK